ncbi:hypothetical protein GCM10008983_01710 [Lentibacillus halophilus]|uniref:Uncharacterized protein n=1 Tax=Lentibacillus halophilus TaxID=295065 RepID=A0ABN0Z282_9BACI
MRRLILYFGVILMLGAVLTGFTDNTGQHASTDESTDIQEGTDGVIAKVKELKDLTEKDASNTEDINELGEALKKNWDTIEKKVETSYPDDYQNIEESLYPLIALAKKDKANKAHIRELSLETLDKLEAFKEKL